MKKSIFILVSLNLLIGRSTTDNDSADQIKGEWVWIEPSGRITGKTETPESTTKEIILEISDNSIKQFVNDTF